MGSIFSDLRHPKGLIQRRTEYLKETFKEETVYEKKTKSVLLREKVSIVRSDSTGFLVYVGSESIRGGPGGYFPLNTSYLIH